MLQLQLFEATFLENYQGDQELLKTVGDLQADNEVLEDINSGPTIWRRQGGLERDGKRDCLTPLYRAICLSL